MPHATGVFLKGDVEHPMQAIFDTPMATHSCAKGSHLPRQAREVIATFCRHLLVGMLFHVSLRQHQVRLLGPGTDRLDRCFPCRPIMGAAGGLPIDGNLLGRQNRLDRLHPREKTLLKLLRV
jgi:hypothetical protein